MGDSDDEYDRRRARDKFRRERSDYQDRREDRGRREDFPERESWNSRDRGGRRDYREYDPRSRRERYSPPPPRHDISPPMKRMRRDWGDDRGGGSGGYMGGNYDMGYHGGGGGGMMHHGNWGAGAGMHHDMNMMHGDSEPGITQPPMMTFKQFLGSQDDTIDDQEAVKKYNEYKVDFRKQQLSEFFINHKEEEWFKSKYHPEEFGKRKSEQHQAINRRLKVFLDLYELNWLSNITVDVEKSEQIIRYLDAVVIKLEGGTENDLKAVDEPYEEEKPPDSPPRLPKVEKLGSDSKDDSKKSQDGDRDKKDDDNNESKESRSADDDSSDESSSSSSDSEDDSDDEDEKSKKDQKEKEKKLRKKKKKKGSSDVEDAANDEVTKVEKTSPEKPKSDETDEGKKVDVKKEEAGDESDISKEKLETSNEEGNEMDTSDTKEEKKVEPEGPPKPRHLHRTSSIFLRNLAPTITKEEVEDMCKKHAGFLRVAINDPQPDRRFFRRGWVTFEKNVNIKDICWNLNTLRLRDCELGAIVNRDLSRRIRSVNGITSHKAVVRADIKIAAKIVQNLDWQKSLWADGKPVSDKEFTLNLISKNPLLKNITDYLIEEASAEEEELLGVLGSEEVKPEGEESSAPVIDRDEALIKVLDRLLMYLRVVHSVDYYNHSDYPNEDEMPNRCGIMHARGSPPNSKISQVEINEYMASFEPKIASFLETQPYLVKEEAVKLGLKDCEAEVEKFIQANTQELGKEKWLCPLSGKKFKGPDFIRKHIFNKHHEKVEEVRQEVEYFNNYLLDSKRPQLPEHPSNRQPTPMPGGPNAARPDMHPMAGGGFMGGGYPPTPHFVGGFGPRGHPPNFGGFGRNNFQDNRSGNFVKRNNYGRGPRGEQRKLINYKDLDAPSESDLY